MLPLAVNSCFQNHISIALNNPGTVQSQWHFIYCLQYFQPMQWAWIFWIFRFGWYSPNHSSTRLCSWYWWGNSVNCTVNVKLVTSVSAITQCTGKLDSTIMDCRCSWSTESKFWSYYNNYQPVTITSVVAVALAGDSFDWAYYQNQICLQ